MNDSELPHKFWQSSPIFYIGPSTRYVCPLGLIQAMSIYRKAARGIHMKKFTEVALALAVLLFTGSAALGQARFVKNDPGNNNPPPAGAILDLNGLPIPGNGDGATYIQYSVDFTAKFPSTAITFAFREDPGFISFTNVSVTDNSLSQGPNLLLNSDFSGGTYTNNGNNLTPISWTYSNQFGATFNGGVQSGCGIYPFCWYDGAVQAYDAISQRISTVVGHSYHVSFSVADNTPCATDTTCYFSDLSTNGDNTSPAGNGRDVTVYADRDLPVPGNSQTVTLLFGNSNGNPETQVATVNENPGDPTAQSLALTLASVKNPIDVTVTFVYEPTEFSSGGTHGPGIADGVCEPGETEFTDFDCRLTPVFTYQTLPIGQVVPHIIPSHNLMGVWVRVNATVVLTGLPAVAGTDYNGPVDWYYAWNTNPPLAPPVGNSPVTAAAVTLPPVNPDYPAGWNNQNPQMYDRPGENLDIAFVKNITTFSKNCLANCINSADPGVGGHTITLNDIVVAAPPNPPTGSYATLEPLVPIPGISPFPYVKTLPMLVTFELENERKETSIANAVSLPHTVSVATFDANGINIPVQFVRGFPTTVTYNPFFKTYYIFLSPAPYKTDGTVYTLQINSDLIAQPFTATFKVKRNQFE